MRIGPYTKLLLQFPGYIHKIQSNLLECQNYDLVKSWNSRQAITCNLLSITSFTTWHKLMASAESAATETAQPLTSLVQCSQYDGPVRIPLKPSTSPSYTCLDLLWDLCMSIMLTHPQQHVCLSISSCKSILAVQHIYSTKDKKIH